MQIVDLVFEFILRAVKNLESGSERFICTFRELNPEVQVLAGGKGSKLALLYQTGFLVPDGFVILPSAFDGDQLKIKAWEQVKTHLKQLSKGKETISFAVRSSASSEDSAAASFAGEFATVLDVRTDEDIRDAIHAVRQSRSSKRVQVYSQARGMNLSHQIAIIVQIFVKPEIAGVLFTSDPVTGNLMVATGNYIHGTGDVLVSGESNALEFSFQKLKSQYCGPPEFKNHAKRLYKLAMRLEEQFSGPQDIEFAIADKKVYIIQTRPVTALKGHDPLKGEYNDSLMGDFLWTNVNSSEACPSIMTPVTWSFFPALFEHTTPIKVPGFPFYGNIGGRLYFNFTLTYSIYRMTMKPEEALQVTEEALGHVPNGLENVKEHSFSKRDTIRILTGYIRYAFKARKFKKKIPGFVLMAPEKCQRMRQQIREAQKAEDLTSIWYEDLKLYLFLAHFMMRIPAYEFGEIVTKIKPDLLKLLGEPDTNTLLSSFDRNRTLESLGPLLGLDQVAKEKMSYEEYYQKYGHRSVDEWEFAAPRPYEISGWLEEQLDGYNKSQVNVDALLNRQKAEFDAVLTKLLANHPKKAKSIQKQIERASVAAIEREAVRSEMARVLGVAREFLIQAGKLTELQDDIFFLTIDEVLNALSGSREAFSHIAARKESYARYTALKSYPTFIRGHFDPLGWEPESSDRLDYYDSSTDTLPVLASDALAGFAGAKGVVEGVVRRLDSPEEGDQLQPGEILVAKTTNIGWTLLFPRAAAIITDVGAPLSHAAIVARELGIPAVVGCGNATMKLRTGDKVLVDGGHGVVKILNATDA